MDDQTEGWTLPPDLASVRSARQYVGPLVADVHDSDDIVLVTSELVANGIRHGTGPVGLQLRRALDLVRLEVTSSGGTGNPTVREAEAHDTGGRGLAIVDMLASRWGWQRSDDVLTVWAEFDRP
jgi:anti-sigma regulatory factor (Ser/Thr protein kinase)